ncbi:hypothetical protein MSLAZ_2743 [Methanosarcina lacustris Z-7289]|uniref:Uncharacterized protein n=1 Tax=Methanosarcina lacustris Z-7289 TaxID=1434111 RepID=A0A0E3S4L0_9EURY|nr:hypothetical protein [Methanosarcina lacustris]AKB76004.1 hypothetical protein MSLAZ_2743 [Methanosarcina lacustris Z-7289]
MLDGGFEIDAQIRSRRSEENLFGVIVDPITKQHVSFPSVPKSEDVGKISEQETHKNQLATPTIQETAKEDYKWIAKGDTYPVKELLKKAGMLWDRQHREWYSNKKPDAKIEGIYIMRKKA